MKPEQFLGWGMYDHSAICLTCKHQHLIAKAEQVSPQPWLDWQHKHRGHETFILPTRLLSELGDKVSGQPLTHNATRKVTYGSTFSYTITLASLASSSTLLAGAESNSVTNASNIYLDNFVAGSIMVGTTPTANTAIEVHEVAALSDGGGTPVWPDVFDGTGSAETITNLGVKAGIVTPLANIVVPVNTSNVAYPFQPTGLARFHGGYLPVAHVIFVTHNTAVALNSTGGNHAIYGTPVYETIA